MGTVFSYENEFNQPITEYQAQTSETYIKITKLNNLIKVKEEYVNNLLSEVTYYQDNESVTEIFNKYPSLHNLDIAKRIEIQGNYIREEIFTHQKSGGLELHSFNIEHILTGRSICFGSYNLQTGEIINESVVKMKYDISGNVSYSYYYNSLGKVSVIEEGNGNSFSNEYSEIYYNSVLPLLPQNKIK